MAKKLTPKQESFCLAYIETGNASEAYRQAYDAENMKPGTINRKAKVELDKGKIRARLEALQAEHRKRHDVTVAGLSENLEIAMNLAFQNKQAAAMVSAIMGRAKLHGLLVDRAELTGKDGGPITVDDVSERLRRLGAMTGEELDARIKELMDRRDVA